MHLCVSKCKTLPGAGRALSMCRMGGCSLGCGQGTSCGFGATGTWAFAGTPSAVGQLLPSCSFVCGSAGTNPTGLSCSPASVGRRCSAWGQNMPQMNTSRNLVLLLRRLTWLGCIPLGPWDFCGKIVLSMRVLHSGRERQGGTSGLVEKPTNSVFIEDLLWQQVWLNLDFPAKGTAECFLSGCLQIQNECGIPPGPVLRQERVMVSVMCKQGSTVTWLYPPGVKELQVPLTSVYELTT